MFHVPRIGIRCLSSRCYSKSCVNKTVAIAVGQGGAIRVDLRNQKRSQLQIISAWQDHCDIQGENILTTVDEQNNSFSLSVPNDRGEGERESSPTIKVIVPELFNIFVQADDIDLQLTNKILGDVSIECQSGIVSVDKIKGTNLNFDCNRGNLIINTLLEGTTNTIRSNNLNAQMINGKEVKISCSGDTKIEAIYSDHTTLTAQSTHLNLAFGKTVVNTINTAIVNNIDGSFIVSSSQGDISLQINKLYPGSSSTAESKTGIVKALVDPQIVASIACHITRDVPLSSSLSPSLSRPDSQSSIVIQSDSFHGFVRNDQVAVGYLAGNLLNNSSETDQKKKKNSGKIDSEAAEKSSLSRPIKEDEKETKEGEREGEEKEEDSPDMVFTAFSSIRVESLSWMGRIKQKYGFTD